MPQNMQTRILRALQDRFETDRFEMVINMDAANTGTMWAVPEGQFASRYSLHFSFQQGYSSFEHNASNGSGLRNVRPIIIHYDQGEGKFAEAMERIVEFMEGES